MDAPQRRNVLCGLRRRAFATATRMFQVVRKKPAFWPKFDDVAESACLFAAGSARMDTSNSDRQIPVCEPSSPQSPSDVPIRGNAPAYPVGILNDTVRKGGIRSVFYGREVVDDSSRPSESTADPSTHPSQAPMLDASYIQRRDATVPRLPSGPGPAEEQIKTVTVVLGTFWLCLLFLFGFATEFDSSVVASEGEMGSLYVYYQQVATMVLVGFGFLYAFLRKYPYGEPPNQRDRVCAVRAG